MSDKFENALLGSGDIMRRAGVALINNAGRAVAFITLAVASIVTFTDLSFAGVGTENFTASVLLMLVSSYLIYFSMEDAGEKTGEDSDEYKAAKAAYFEARASVGADKIEALRDFCKDYAEAELEYRRCNMLIGCGESLDSFKRYLSGEQGLSKEKIRIFKKAAKLKAVDITPKILLSAEHTSSKSELSNPEAFKFLRLAIRLIPTTLCMLLTVSIIPSAKENMTASAIIEGILKLSSLPIIGFRGYSAGYFYARKSRVVWLETKTRLLSAFTEKTKN